MSYASIDAFTRAFVNSYNAVAIDLPDHCGGCGHHIAAHSERAEDGHEEHDPESGLSLLIRCLMDDCPCKRYEEPR